MGAGGSEMRNLALGCRCGAAPGFRDGFFFQRLARLECLYQTRGLLFYDFCRNPRENGGRTTSGEEPFDYPWPTQTWRGWTDAICEFLRAQLGGRGPTRGGLPHSTKRLIAPAEKRRQRGLAESVAGTPQPAEPRHR